MALPREQLRRMIEEAAKSAGVPSNLLAALVEHESGGDPGAVSSAGAVGLTQLLPSTARSLGVDPHDPWQNLLGGAKYLRQQYDRFGRWDLALAAYNAGPGAVQEHGGIPPYKETQAYVSKVLRSAGERPPIGQWSVEVRRQTTPGKRFVTAWERAGKPPVKPLPVPKYTLPPPEPPAAERGITPPEIRAIQEKTAAVRLPSEKRALELWEGLRAQVNALRRAAAAGAAARMPGATEEEIAKEAARTLKEQGTLLPEEAPARAKEVLKIVETGKKAASGLGAGLDWIVRQLGRPWAGIKAQIKATPEESAQWFGGLRAFARGFLHPEQVGELLPPEKVPSRLVEAIRSIAMRRGISEEKATPEEVRKALSGAVETGGEFAFDPSMWVGIGPVARFGKGIEAAARTAERLEKAVSAQKKLTAIAEKTEKALQEAEKVAKQYPKAVLKAEKARESARKLLQKLREKPPKRATARAKAAQRLMEARRKAQEALKQERELRAVVEARKPLEQRLGRIRAAKERMAALERELSLPAPRYLKIAGVPVVSVEPAFRRLSEAMARFQLRPTVQPIAAVTTHYFRLTEPRPREGKALAEYMAEKETLPLLYHRVREAGSRAMLLAKEAVEPFAKIPKRAREVAAHVVEQPARAQEFKEALPKELHEAVDRAADIWRTDRDTLTKRLVDALGSDFEARLIEDYLPHIIIGHPGKKARFLKTLAENPQKVLDDILRMSPATRPPTRMERAVPGAKPFFTYDRVIQTLEGVKEYVRKQGLDVVEDVGLIDAMYRYAAEKMLWMKDTADWLERIGWIRSAKKAPKDWWDAGSAFPWYKEKGMRLHPEAARLLEEINKVLKPSEEIRPLLKAYDQVMSLFKGAVTSLRPAFHLINAAGNMILMRMAGIGYPQQVTALKDAIRVLTGKHPRARQIMTWFRQAGLEGTGMFADTRMLTERVLAQIADHLEEVEKGLKGKIKAALWPRGASTLERATGMAAGRNFGEFTDSVMRLAAFIHFLKEGMAPHNAARLVREYMADYNLLTSSEKNLRRFIFPFYTWAKFAAGRSLAAMLMQPGAYTGYEHFVNALDRMQGFDRDVLPPYLQWAVVLGDDDTGRVVFVNPQPPWQQLFTMTSRELPGDVPEAGREVIGSVSPFIQGAVIAAGGKDITGRSFPEEEFGDLPVWAQRLRNVLRQFTPAWEFEKLYPERPGAPLQVTGRLVTGLKGYPVSFLGTYDVSLAHARNIQRAKKALDDYAESLEARGVVEQIPEASKVEAAQRGLEKEEIFQRVWREIQSDPEKRRLAELFISGARKPTKIVDVLRDNADLLEGTHEEVRRKIGALFSEENRRRLAVYLGREPTVNDFLTYRRQLEENTLETVPRPIRELQRMFEQLRKLPKR